MNFDRIIHEIDLLLILSNLNIKNNIDKMTTKTLVYLESVGTYLNIETLDTHPATAKDRPDFNPGATVNLKTDEVNISWIQTLSKKDTGIISRFIDINNITLIR